MDDLENLPCTCARATFYTPAGARLLNSASMQQ